MITYIIGKVNFIDKKFIIIENNCIGYTILFNMKCKLNDTIKVYIYHYKTDYLNEYYGFSEYENLLLFKELINIKGIGCKFSFSIASNNVNEVLNAISNKDVNYLSNIPKIGLKMANKIISSYEPQIKFNKELFDALIVLGYKKKEIYEIINKINTFDTLDKQIKQSLSLLQERK